MPAPIATPFIISSLQTGVVTNAMRADMAADTISGRANGAGTGVPTDLTAVQVCAILSAANDTITTAGSAVTDLDTSSLDGDNDGDYLCQDTLMTVTGATVYSLQPNAVATDQTSNGIYTAIVPAVEGEAMTVLLLGGADTATAIVYAWYKLMSKSGRSRMYAGHTFGSQATPYTEVYAGVWTGAGNITSIRRHSSVASRINTGSFGRVRRMRNLV